MPITLPILQQIVQSFQHTVTSAYQSKHLSATCSIAFFAFLRIGEITVNSTDQSNLIKVNQLYRLAGSQQHVKALQLTFINYKHSDSGRPFVVYISTESKYCPVERILEYLSARGPISGLLFCWPNGAPIKKSFFVEKLNVSLTFCSLHPSLYKSHSFCIGVASWASAKGFSDSQIRQLGRWRSNAFVHS